MSVLIDSIMIHRDCYHKVLVVVITLVWQHHVTIRLIITVQLLLPITKCTRLFLVVLRKQKLPLFNAKMFMLQHICRINELYEVVKRIYIVIY